MMKKISIQGKGKTKEQFKVENLLIATQKSMNLMFKSNFKNKSPPLKPSKALLYDKSHLKLDKFSLSFKTAPLQCKNDES